MFEVTVCSVPKKSLLAEYDPQQSSRCPGAYVDCYVVEYPEVVSLARFVSAFYTTRVFKMERLILQYAVSRPSTDEQAQAVAMGSSSEFAAWDTEARTDTELLMCDLRGRTRSWFGIELKSKDEGPSTLLRFGSVVVPQGVEKQQPSARLGWQFRWLLGFHKAYSRILLSSALKRLRTTASPPSV